MTHTKKTTLSAHISLFLLVSSSVLPIFSQDIASSFAMADITMPQDHTEIKNVKATRNTQLSPEEHAKLMAEFQKLLEAQAKKDDTAPKIKPSTIVSFALRFPAAYLYFRYAVPYLEDKLKNKALCEILKMSFITWMITEPIKDHAKPYYEYFRDKFDAFIDDFFPTEEEEEESNAEAAHEELPVAA